MTHNGSGTVVAGVTVRGGRIVALDILAYPERLADTDLTVVEDPPRRDRR
jgi:hypothetical protein